MTKTVCIIGAGPAGLAAAKSLIYDHPSGAFHVTVFEKSDSVGGLWPVSKEDDGMVNPDMRTNQSRHTVSFSDLAWPATTPVFPKAWQVGQYLQRYVRTYPGYEIKTGSAVVHTEIVEDKWKVHIKTKTDATPTVLDFDHMIIASGFFGKPIIPEVLAGFPAPVIHSSKFRNIGSLGINTKPVPSKTGRNIVIVGGQMSGVEVAASLALKLSSDVNTPNRSSLNPDDSYSITHVIQKPFWVMPCFFPTNPQLLNNENNPAPTFLPLDLTSYNLEVRPPGPLINTSGHITEEGAARVYDHMQKTLGGDQSDIGIPELTVTTKSRTEPPFLTISDDYTEFLRSGNIKLVKGKVTGKSKDGSTTIIVEDEGQGRQITDVAAVIFATGFEPAPSLDFLPADILQTLQLDSKCDEFPLALNVHSTVSRIFPSLGFVGFYRSPYWAVIEMQARYLGKLWRGDKAAEAALAEDTTMCTMLKLRGDPRRAQFPMGDYAYLLESFSNLLGIKRQEPSGDLSSRTGQVTPARYTYADAGETEKAETNLALKLFYDAFEESRQGKYLAKVVFRAMQGDWKLNREIKSFIESYPSGTLEGTAQFLPRYPTEEGFDFEYLYLEKGEFTSSSGLKFTAKRSYVYRYSEPSDKLTVWFTKDDHKTVDYFFHEVIFSPEPEPLGWHATSDHWCKPDQYDVEYDFAFKGVYLEKWSPKYKVKGPNKDYTISSTFTR